MRSIRCLAFVAAVAALTLGSASAAAGGGRALSPSGKAGGHAENRSARVSHLGHATVSGVECPPGSACATLGNGQSLCVRTCGRDFACDRDPLLRCEPAGSAGPLGFQVTPPVAGATYCAPRKCAAETECDPAGTCLPPGAGGHCQLP